MQSLWRDYEWRRTKFNEELTGRGEEIKTKDALEEIHDWEDFAMRNFALWLQPTSHENGINFQDTAPPKQKEGADLA